MAANSIFLYALKDEGYHSILNILARSNTDNIHKRDFSFIRNCFTLLSGPTKDDISIEQLEIIKNEAISSLNLAAGAVVIEENIIANDRLANDGNDGDNRPSSPNLDSSRHTFVVGSKVHSSSLDFFTNGKSCFLCFSAYMYPLGCP